MRADRACDKRKRVFLRDNLHRVRIFFVFYKLQICRDILMNRTSFFTRRGEAVQKRHLLLHLSGRQGFYCFYMMRIGLRLLHQFLHRRNVDPVKYRPFFFKQSRHLRHSVVSARFQQRCGDRYRPDAGFNNLFNIVIIRSSGI